MAGAKKTRIDFYMRMAIINKKILKFFVMLVCSIFFLIGFINLIFGFQLYITPEKQLSLLNFEEIRHSNPPKFLLNSDHYVDTRYRQDITPDNYMNYVDKKSTIIQLRKVGESNLISGFILMLLGGLLQAWCCRKDKKL